METYDIREAGPGPIISNIRRQLEAEDGFPVIGDLYQTKISLRRPASVAK